MVGTHGCRGVERGTAGDGTLSRAEWLGWRAADSTRRPSESVRQYSSLCVGAVVLTLSGFDIVEADVQDREQWRASRGARERGRRQNENKQRALKHVTSWMTCGWSDCAPKTPWGTMWCVHKVKVFEKNSLVRCIISLQQPVQPDRSGS